MAPACLSTGGGFDQDIPSQLSAAAKTRQVSQNSKMVDLCICETSTASVLAAQQVHRYHQATIFPETIEDLFGVSVLCTMYKVLQNQDGR